MAAKRYKKGVGGFDTKDFPQGKPSGISNAMNIPSPLEAGADISKRFGPAAPNPPRGSKQPNLGAHRPVQERKQK